MPAFRDYKLQVPTTGSTAGQAFPCHNLDQKWVQIGGTIGGGRSVRIQGTMNDTDWQDVNGGIGSKGLYPVCQTLSQVRIFMGTLGTGNTTATLVGRDVETFPR